MIVAAAIQAADGTVLTKQRPARHADIITSCYMSGLQLWNESLFKRGFLDDTGMFHGRRAALDHALQCGQQLLASPNLNLGLYSEDLW